MGGGGNVSGGGGSFSTNTSTSRPLTAGERSESFNAGINNITSTMPAWAGMGTYNAPQFQSMTGGDYDRLEQNILTSRVAPLVSAYQTQAGRLDSDLAKRGIYSSGAATQAQNDLTGSFLPQLTAAGAEAATQRYGLQNQELSALNQYNMENANRDYAAKWRPADYMSGIWNNTGGVISSGSQVSQGGGSDGGWNFTI